MLNDEVSVVNVDSSSEHGIHNIQRDIREYFPVRVGEETMLSFAGLVDDNTKVDRDEWQSGINPKSRQPINIGKASMAYFLRNDAEGYKLLAKEIDQVAKTFLDYTCGRTTDNVTGRYLSDVFLFRGRRQLDQTLDVLRQYGESRRRGMFGISVEEDHIHIIHDCSYSCGSCRCSFKEKIRPFGEFGPNRRYNKPLWKFTRTDWYDVIVYFFFAKRGTREVWFRGESWEVPNDGKFM